MLDQVRHFQPIRYRCA